MHEPGNQNEMMNKAIIPVVISGLLLVQQSGAVTIVECEDQEGNRTFQSHCPPGSTEITEKAFSTSIAAGPGQPDITPVVYLAPECRACDAVRTFFQNQEIGIREINIDDNEELQNELRGIVGDLRVPTVVVGQRFVTNYRRDLLVQVLEEAGFTLNKEGF